jgi:hypothetical protein
MQLPGGGAVGVARMWALGLRRWTAGCARAVVLACDGIVVIKSTRVRL